MAERRILIGWPEWRRLVRGHVIELWGVEIALEDLGLQLMREDLEQAMTELAAPDTDEGDDSGSDG